MQTKKSDCEAINPDIVQQIQEQFPLEHLSGELSDFFKVMGDSTRIKILWVLEKNALCVNDIAVLLNMTKSAVSHQLKILRISKLIRSEKKGKNVYYALNDDHVQVIFAKALEHICE